MSFLHGIFPHPLIIEELTLDVDAIKEFCYSVKSASTSRDSTNIGGWQSYDLDWTKCNHGAFYTLIKQLEISIKNAGIKIGIKPTMILDNLWININGKGCYNTSHAHPGSLLSGTFYVDVPDNSGDIEFDNPNGLLIDSYLTSWKLTRKVDELIDSSNPMLAYSTRVGPVKNMLLLFPSWTKHSVGINHSSNDRISISFNTGVDINENT